MKNLGKWMVVALFFIAVMASTGEYAFSQKTAGKPAPTVWGAQISYYGNLLSLGGDDHIYKTGDSCRLLVAKQRDGSYHINFFIFPEYDVNAQFFGVNITGQNAAVAGPGGFCGFPSPFNQYLDCVNQFFNSDHPKANYDHLMFMFSIGADIENTNIFPQGLDKLWTGTYDSSLFIWNSLQNLSAGDPFPYHSVSATHGNMTPGGGEFWIKRVDANTWEFRIEQGLYNITEHYNWATPVIGKGGKITEKVTRYEPFSGSGNISYKIRLIKNPS